MNNSFILVVEDDAAIRNLIKTALELENYKYHLAINAAQALTEATTQMPDIILLDLGLPDMDGIEIIKRIRTWSSVPIMVITARAEDRDKIEALDAGADDYLTKPFSTSELLARIRSTYRRISYQSCGVKAQVTFENGSLRIDYGLQEAYVLQEAVHLTPTEYRILCLLAKNIGRVLTHTFITKEIWGSSLESDIASLRVHVATLRKKIEVLEMEGSTAEEPLVRTHIGIGYCMMKRENL